MQLKLLIQCLKRLLRVFQWGAVLHHGDTTGTPWGHHGDTTGTPRSVQAMLEEVVKKVPETGFWDIKGALVIVIFHNFSALVSKVKYIFLCFCAYDYKTFIVTVLNAYKQIPTSSSNSCQVGTSSDISDSGPDSQVLIA